MTSKLNDIINKLDNVILESDYDVLFSDPFIDRLVRYNHEYVESRSDTYSNPRRRNHNLLFVKGLYRHFNFMVTHMNEYEVLVDYLCKCQNQNLRYLDAMILQCEVPITPVLEMFINRVHKDLEVAGLFTFSYDYKNQKFRSLTETYSELINLPDTKTKLSGFLALEAKIKSMYWTKTYIDKCEDLTSRVLVEIQKLRNMLEIGLLPADVPAIVVQKKTKSSSLIALKKKTDFFKILSAMYDAGIFVNAAGDKATNKQKLMEDMGVFMNDDFSAYSASLSQAKTRDEKTFLKPFKEIEKEALRYFNTVGE